jgi:fatty-acid peroxygenase
MSLVAPTRPIPRLGRWDSSLALLADPYRFIGTHCTALETDVFEARLLFQRTICMRGAAAAELFYDASRFCRAGAAPEPIRATLFGKGVVQGLDDAPHRQRKALFTHLLGAEAVERLAEHVETEWETALPRWERAGSVSVCAALRPILTRAACLWAGVPLRDDEVPGRARQLTALFDSAASGPRRHVHARLARLQTEAWLARLVDDVRSGRSDVAPGSAAHRVAVHRDASGALLPERVAAAELLNVLRPIVAVSVYVSFVAHALHSYPAWRVILTEPGTSAEAMAFVQEVRRHYPFFPAIVARVRRSFHWNGMHFPEGRRALLDLYGTNHDPRAWPEPHSFSPARWDGAGPRPYTFVPQGGGDVATQHRCPGEDVAVRLMLLAVQVLVQRMRYVVTGPMRDIDMSRLPALPRQGFVIENIRLGSRSRY